jgi:hypothetical protein
VLNAAAVACSFSLSQDGYELQVGDYFIEAYVFDLNARSFRELHISVGSVCYKPPWPLRVSRAFIGNDGRDSEEKRVGMHE